jgi:hypothetical protein
MKTADTIRFIVINDYETFNKKMYLEAYDNGRKVIIGMKDGLLTEQILENNTCSPIPIKPLLEMPLYLGEDFLKAVANYLSSEGIKTENENLLKGKLDATEKHLEDLRRNFDKLLNKVVE